MRWFVERGDCHEIEAERGVRRLLYHWARFIVIGARRKCHPGYDSIAGRWGQWGAITTVATGDGSASINGLSYGTFTSISAVGLGFLNYPSSSSFSALFSNVLAASSATPGVLTVYVTQTGVFFPQSIPHGGVVPIISGFTANLLPVAGDNLQSTGWTVEETTYLTAAFDGQTLGDITFNAPGATRKSDVGA
jgi:hypothetical protein